MEGWIVQIGRGKAREYYAVATPDPMEALALVRKKLGAHPSESMRAVQPVTAEYLAAHGLKAGDMRPNAQAA